MKSVLVILALVAVAGCSGMRSGSSSGSMGADTSSGSMSGSYPSRNLNIDPGVNAIAPTMALP